MVNLVTPVVQWSSAMARIESCAIVAVVQSYLVSMRTTYYLSKPVTQCLLATSCESFYRVLLGGSRNRMRNLPDLMVMPVMPVMMMMMMVMPVIMMPLTFTFWGLTPSISFWISGGNRPNIDQAVWESYKGYGSSSLVVLPSKNEGIIDQWINMV